MLVFWGYVSQGVVDAYYQHVTRLLVALSEGLHRRCRNQLNRATVAVPLLRDYAASFSHEGDN